MKPPKKPFIVEFKQARRARTKPQPLIWGAVDLRVSGDHLSLGAVKREPQRSSSLVAPLNAAEPAKAKRILPALASTPALDLTEVPSIVESRSEHTDDIEMTGEVPVGSNVLSTELEAIACEAPKARSRRGNGEILPAGQRWKRRLPPILRQG